MDENEATPDHSNFKEAIHAFINGRLQAKLEKIKDDGRKRQELLEQHVPQTWLEDAARRVQQIQIVTHSLKPIHPDARGTNLYVSPEQLPTLQEVGSHVLGGSLTSDVVGNAAALDVYKLLKLEVEGQSLLSALLTEDAGAMQALHDDPVQARTLRDAFVSLTAPRTDGVSSHTYAKQLYWLVGKDAANDVEYELLVPLYATSLTHAVWSEIQEHRFGEANKAARQARRDRKHHDGVYCEYPDLAVQKLGGTKPQNISQLNSERGGVNYLLSSLPPVWKASAQRLPVHAESVFDRMFGVRPDVRRAVKTLREFLATDPEPNAQTRERRDALVDSLIDELVALAAELQQLQPGWTLDDSRFTRLHRAEQLWLDPLRAELPGEETFAQEWMALEWPAEIGRRFGRWLNQQLQHRLHVGDVEARAWARELLADEDGFMDHLRTLSRRLGKREVIA
jgi:CRISPR-associated protein Csy1